MAPRRTPAGEICGLTLVEREGLVAMQLDAVRPVPGGQPGLVHQLADKLFRRTDLFPDLRQKSGAVSSVFDQEAVDTGPQLA